MYTYERNSIAPKKMIARTYAHAAFVVQEDLEIPCIVYLVVVHVQLLACMHMQLVILGYHVACQSATSVYCAGNCVAHVNV